MSICQQQWQQQCLLIFLLIFCCNLLVQVNGSGYMTLQFLVYNNHDSRCSDGTFCDSVFFLNSRESACDPRFRLVADKTTPGGTGLYDYQQGNYYSNQDVINFGSSFGEITNPVTVNMPFNDNQGSIHISVVVTDDDTFNDDPMDTFSATLQASGTEHKSLTMRSLPLGHTLSLNYWFTCRTNYYGSLCNTHCVAHNDATNGHYTCDANGHKVCLAGWIGAATDCKTQHPCQASVCRNGAICETRGEGYECRCLPDYSGTQCENFLDPCQHRNPCHNGGRCFLNDDKQPQCRCPAEFSDPKCDTDVDECATSEFGPCHNRMQCVNTHGGFKCNCTDPHFAGRLCELHVCNGTVCHNNGTCRASFERGPVCVCPTGIVGDSCETNVDDCADNPCRNGATCRDLVADFACDCPAGFSGRLCETNVNDCADNPCHNGATCRDLVADFACDCSIGFAGRLCERNVDDCAENRCQNGGTCVDGVASFSCICRPGFSGRTCERPPPTPAPNSTAERQIGGTPDSEPSGASTNVAGVAGGLVVGFLVLVGFGTALGVWLLRYRLPSERIPDDASTSSSGFSNAVYNNSGSTLSAPVSVYSKTMSLSPAIDELKDEVYEEIGTVQINNAYEAEGEAEA